MFDIGFWELSLVALITLLVVGPDRLPGLVRNVGLWVGRVRQFANSVKTELEDEVARADELKRLAEEQLEIAKRHNILDESKPTVAAKPSNAVTAAEHAEPAASGAKNEAAKPAEPTTPPAQS